MIVHERAETFEITALDAGRVLLVQARIFVAHAVGEVPYPHIDIPFDGRASERQFNVSGFHRHALIGFQILPEAVHGFLAALPPIGFLYEESADWDPLKKSRRAPVSIL